MIQENKQRTKNMKIISDAFDNKQLVDVGKYKFVINPLTEQVPCTDADLLRAACEECARNIDPTRTTKLVTEEDKGAILLAGVSLITGLPFGMARWQPNGLGDQIPQTFNMEYAEGNLWLSGIAKGDQVTVIDDMLSTGGTLIALIKTIEKAGAFIVDIICVAEKINYGAKKRIKDETGYDVTTLVKVDVWQWKLSKVIVE